MDEDIATNPEAVVTPGVAIIGSTGLHEFIRYFGASAAALAVDAGLLALLTSVLGVPYLWSGAVGFTAGLTVVYLLSIKWVFQNRSLTDARAEAAIFAVIGVVGLGLNEAVLYALVELVDLHYGVAKLASVAVVFSWNFGARKYLLFRAVR
jgi:putative flippase GtrA